MKVELSKQDLINMVKGMRPSYELMDHPWISNQGTYCGGFNDTWDWKVNAFEYYTEEKIFETYMLLKNQYAR